MNHWTAGWTCVHRITFEKVDFINVLQSSDLLYLRIRHNLKGVPSSFNTILQFIASQVISQMAENFHTSPIDSHSNHTVVSQRLLASDISIACKWAPVEVH